MPEEELVTLHKTAKDLYDTFIKIGAINFIKFDDDIIKDVGAIINQGHKRMYEETGLQVSMILFRNTEAEDDSSSVPSL